MAYGRSSVACALLCSAVIACGQQVKVEKYVLPNGMNVILHEDHRLPRATVNIWYYVGSKDEPPRHSGFAHLFEHLMFMGTFRVPRGQFDKIMESHGGSNNASTAEDRTNYFSVGPANLLPTLLWLDADRLESLGKAMSQAKLDLQRDVVKNERRETIETAPYGEAEEKVSEGLLSGTFPVWSATRQLDPAAHNGANVQFAGDTSHDIGAVEPIRFNVGNLR